MKNLICKDYEIVNYSEKYFKEILENLKVFQKKAKMIGYENNIEQELKKELKKATHVLMTIDKQRNDKIIWVACFEIKGDKCDMSLGFKNDDYEWRSSLKSIQKIFNLILRLSNAKFITCKISRTKKKAGFVWVLKKFYKVKFLDNDNVQFFKN